LSTKDATTKNILHKLSMVICPQCHECKGLAAQKIQPVVVSHGELIGNWLAGQEGLEHTQIQMDSLTGEFVPNLSGL
jgi:hypothetical protein